MPRPNGDIHGSDCHGSVGANFAIEWDESILAGDEAPIQIGSVLQTDGIPKMLPNGTWVPTSNLRVSISTVGPTDEEVYHRLPKRYHQSLRLFQRKAAQRLPVHKVWDHEICTEPGTTPPWGPIYPMSELELKTLREYLDEMIKSGKIRPSHSPAGAPILFVPKPGGGLRLVVDYRGLNKITTKNRYPLPLMDELRDRTRGAKIFTEIDLKSGYSNIRIKEGDEWKTAFRMRYRHYEYLVMPEGLTNAPALFQAMMNEILWEYLDQGVVVYLDNILIYSRNEEEHEVLVKKVLQILMDNDLAGNIDKCHFHTKELNFLSYIISPEGVKIANDCVRTILN